MNRKEFSLSLTIGGVLFLAIVIFKWLSDRYTIVRPGFPGYFTRDNKIWTEKRGV